jgi:hypothetical protein
MVRQSFKVSVAHVALVGGCVLILAACAGSVELGPDAVVISLSSK